MRNHFAIVAAVALTVGTWSLAQQAGTGTAAAGQTDNATNTSATARDAAGTTASSIQTGTQSAHAEDIRKVLADVVEQGVQGDTDGVAGYFTDNSSDQFKHHGKNANASAEGGTTNAKDQKEAGKQADDGLKNTAKQLKEAWKAKYNHDFDLDRKNEATVFGADMVQIMSGDVGNAAQTAGARAGNEASGSVNSSKSNSDDNNAIHKDDTRSATDKAASGRTNASGASTNIQDRMATVIVQESHGLPTVNLTVANEGTFGNKWRIQPPPGLRYETLSQNLNASLQHCLGMKDQWPADENEARRQIAHSILAAVGNAQGISGSSGASAGSSTDAAQTAGSTSGTTESRTSSQQNK